MKQRINYNNSNVWLMAQKKFVERKVRQQTQQSQIVHRGIITDRETLSLERKVNDILDGIKNLNPNVTPAF